MAELYVLRHAKASADGDAPSDHDRPLAARGERAAALLGAWLRQLGAQPGLALCSSALRARQTLEWLLPAWGHAPRVEVEEALYLASAARLFERLRRLPAGTGGVLLVGHNPGLQDLVVQLCDRGPRVLRERVGARLPTAGCCVVRIEDGAWPWLGPGDGLLERFAVPKELV